MNRKILSIALVVAMMTTMTTLAVPAAGEQSGDLTYTSDGTSVTITKYTGAGGDVIIPDTIGDLPVTIIGDRAFSGCTKLVSVTIPDNVTSIGKRAFYGCTALASIIIPDSVTAINEWAFYGCTALASIIIPDSVTTIGDFAFDRCKALASATIGNNVTTIGMYAFSECAKLASVTIGDNVTGIGDRAFWGCAALTSVTIGSGSIGRYAFYGCTALTSVTIGSGVTGIGEDAFSGCAKLASVTIGSGSIGIWTFRGCAALTSVTIGSGVTTIGIGVFYNCTALTSVTIPDSVTGIGNQAFSGCTALASIIIPDSVTTIDTYAFSGCTALTSVTIGSGSIGGYAFSGCTALTAVTIGSGVTSIGDLAFSGCTALTSIIIPDSVTGIGSSAFRGCSKLASVTIGSGSIGGYAFQGCAALTAVTIGSGVTGIGDRAFERCTALTSIIIPDSVTGIGAAAFYQCTDLTSIIIPDSVTAIGAAAFYQCTALTAVTLGSGVTAIGAAAFYQCTALTSVTIGSGVTAIGSSAFQGCTALTAIIFDGNAPSVGSLWLTGTPSSLLIYHSSSAAEFTSPTWQGKTTAVLGSTPTAPNAVSVTAGDRQATLTWSAPVYAGGSDIDYYIIYRDGKDVLHVTEMSATISGLVNGQSYEFKVAAHNANGKGLLSGSVAVTLPGVLIHSPADGSHLNTNSTAVEWSFVGGDIDHFLVVLDGEELEAVPAETLSYLLRDLSDAVHVVTITAVTTGGTIFSSEVSFVVDTVRPTMTDRSPEGSDVATGSAVTVAFSEGMNTSSVVITVDGVTGTVTWDGNTAAFAPSATLKGNTAYTVTVSGKDLAGNALRTDRWTFTTANVGTVSGVIKDQDGHPVAGAAVKLKSGSVSSQVRMATVFSVESTVGKTLTTTTNAQGEYAFYDVSIGEYTLTVEKDGFGTTAYSVKVTSDTVASGTVTVDGVLSVESVSEDDALPTVGIAAVVIVAALGVLLLVRRKKGGTNGRDRDGKGAEAKEGKE